MKKTTLTAFLFAFTLCPSNLRSFVDGTFSVHASATAYAAEPDPRAPTKFTASARERFVFMLWFNSDSAKTVAAQDEAMSIWSRLELREIKARKPAPGKESTSEDDFSDTQASFTAGRDEVEAIVRELTPTDQRAMPNVYSVTLYPFRKRLEGILKAAK